MIGTYFRYPKKAEHSGIAQNDENTNNTIKDIWRLNKKPDNGCSKRENGNKTNGHADNFRVVQLFYFNISCFECQEQPKKQRDSLVDQQYDDPDVGTWSSTNTNYLREVWGLHTGEKVGKYVYGHRVCNYGV